MQVEMLWSEGGVVAIPSDEAARCCKMIDDVLKDLDNQDDFKNIFVPKFVSPAGRPQPSSSSGPKGVKRRAGAVPAVRQSFPDTVRQYAEEHPDHVRYNPPVCEKLSGKPDLVTSTLCVTLAFLTGYTRSGVVRRIQR
eukprot:TRINITY_DN23767_c0_g1_i1.p1 TRINITY_DN23767_c0_g1~~TRINITY_DN23767_c0_g1_i1.p1  ORF type:complete len:138 (+),score=10.46 TRINITY_DN23767_c0_g1_i1:1-414(+)